MFSCKYPTIWKLFVVLVNHIGTHRLIVQNVNTIDVYFPKTKYAIIAERQAEKVAFYIDKPDKPHYLRAIAHMQVPR